MLKRLTTLAILWGASQSAVAADYMANVLKIIQPPHSQIAITATDLASGKLIFEQNADTLMLPASTQKLLTAVTASYLLGPDFSFQTQLKAASPIVHGHLQGDLFIEFNGDPTLSSDEIRSLLLQLKQHGVEHVDGAVYLVGNNSSQTQANGWVWDDLGICYAAPVSDFVINQNCIKAQLKPKLASKQSRVVYPNYLPAVITTSATFDKTRDKTFCHLDLKRLPENHYHISGCYADNKTLPLSIAVSDPGLYAQKTLSSLLNHSQISVAKGVYVIERSPADLFLIAEHRSQKLTALLKTMLEDSDNLIADSLFKQLGQHFYQRHGNFNNGAQAMASALTDLGVDIKHAQIADGSGLSRYNLITANQLAQVLTLIHTETKFKYLRELLPISGKSGTLRYKSLYTQTPLAGAVAAKTGSMQGVDNLAGFIHTERFADTLFVILENGLSPNEKEQQLAPFNALFLQSLLDRSQPPSSQ